MSVCIAVRKYMLSCLYLALLQGIILGITGEEKIARKNNWKF